MTASPQAQAKPESRFPRVRDPERRMTLGGHLREFRRRTMMSAAGIAVGALAGWIWYQPVFDVLQAPVLALTELPGRTVTLNFSGIASSFDMQLKIAAFTGVLISSPWWLLQLWLFITPALTRRERRYTLGYLGASVPLFAGGAALAWYLLPQAVALLTSFTPDGAANIIDASEFLGFVMRMMIAFGVAFLVPVLVVALNAVGLVAAATWWHGWRWAIVIAFTFAAVATPTGDIVSMLILGVPICVLYLGSAAMCSINERRAAKLSHESQ